MGPIAGGTRVTIAGADFSDATGVTFGGTSAASYTVDSATQITATAPAALAAGTVQVQVTGPNGGSPAAAAADFTYVVTYTSIRGADRFDTAIQMSQARFPGALPAGSGLVVAPGYSFQEALCGAPLAAAYGGPVLLNPTTLLLGGVKAEILRLRPRYVFLIGLSDNIKNAVQTALGNTGTAMAIRGTGGSVYDMSYKVAKALGKLVGDMSGAVALVTVGTNYPDALGLAPLACAQGWPILLTDRTAGALHPKSAQAMRELGISQMLKVGTYVAEPPGVTKLGNLSGDNRYDTNRRVAEWARANAGLTFVHTAFATGDKFPDALACGPYLAADRGILLLSPLQGPVPDPVASALSAEASAVQHVSFIACIEPVIGQVLALLPQAVPLPSFSFLPYGDSKTVGWGDETHQGGYPYILAAVASSRTLGWRALPRLARGGWNVTSMAYWVDRDLAGYTGGKPDAVLINLGANLTETTQLAWVTPMLRIVDAIHAKWPNAHVFIARVRRGSNPTEVLNDAWIPAVVAARPDFVHLGIDERTFLPGEGLMSDTFHPNRAGYVRTAEEWSVLLKQWFGQ
jgi:lysophospholipase L1-like esterase